MPKEPGNIPMETFRGIALLSCLLKWYISTLILLSQRYPTPQRLSNVLTVGFSKLMSVYQVTAPLQLLLAKAYEWPERAPLYVFIGDVATAFDKMTTSTAARALSDHLLPARLVAALTRENTGCIAEMLFPDLAKEIFISFNACERQGSTDAPEKSNACMRMITSRLVHTWIDAGFGYRSQGRLWTHVYWADNLFLLANSERTLRKMAADMTVALRAHGFTWKKKSLQFISPCSWTEPFTLDCGGNGDDDQDIVTIPPVSNTVQLGVWLEQDGSTKPSVAWRKQKAMNAYFSEPEFRRKNLSMSQRFARYSELISPILSFGCEGWALSWSVMSDLHTFEGGLLRRIAQFRKPPTITLRKHLQASAKRARTFFMTGGHKKIEEIVLKKYLQFCFASTGRTCPNDGAAFSLPRQWLQCAINQTPHDQWKKKQDEELTLRNTRARLSGCSGFKEARSCESAWQHRKGYGARYNWEQPIMYLLGIGWRNRLGAIWYDTIEKHALSYLQSQGLNGNRIARVRKKIFDDRQVQQKIIRQARIVEPEYVVKWRESTPATTRILVDIKGDNESVVNWVNGCWKCDTDKLLPAIDRVQNQLSDFWLSETIFTADVHSSWVRHVYREHNSEADSMATETLRRKDNLWKSWVVPDPKEHPVQLCCSFDGGSRNRAGSAAWTILVKTKEGAWRKWRERGIYVPQATAICMELTACADLVGFLTKLSSLTTWRQLTLAVVDGV